MECVEREGREKSVKRRRDIEGMHSYFTESLRILKYGRLDISI